MRSQFNVTKMMFLMYIIYQIPETYIQDGMINTVLIKSAEDLSQ